jgi:hypothetical protein
MLANVFWSRSREMGSGGMNMRRMAGLLLVLSTIVSLAQTVVVTGSVRGQITDTTGAAISAAQVDLLEEATGRTSTQITQREGTFIFPALVVGNIRLWSALLVFEQPEFTA